MKPNTIVFAALFCLAAQAADWPQWRGPNRNGLAPPGSACLTHLPPAPRTIWRFNIGGGVSSPAVAGGKLVYLDAQDDQETAHLLDATTGRELWHTNYDTVYADEWGPGPRSTPIMDGDRVYVQSCRGEFRCLSLITGDTLWRTNFERDFGVKFLGSGAGEGTASRRGNNGCGVIADESVFVPVGSTNGASIVAFDKMTGRILWKVGNDEAAYSSLVIASLAGVRQVVAFTAEALLGADVKTGRILWRVPIKTVAKRNVVTPVICGDDVIVSSFTAGMICTRITRAGDGLQARGIWTNSTLRVNLSTPVRIGTRLFMQAPMRQLVCADALAGKQLWSRGGFAQTYAAFIGLGQAVLVLTDNGELRLLAADDRNYVELGRAQVCGETWSHAAFADGRLYVRSGLTANWTLQCLDLSP